MLPSMKKMLVTMLVIVLLANACRATTDEEKLDESSRVKRGYGHGGGHGHGPGKGGGASGPIYFCGYVGKSEGYGGYGK